MLMAYDVRSGIALLSRMYKGGAADAVSVRELFWQAHLAGMLFLADKGFLSEENLALFTSDGNQYVIELSKSDRRCRASVALEAKEGSQGRFVWTAGALSTFATSYSRRRSRRAISGTWRWALPDTRKRGSMRCFPTWV